MFARSELVLELPHGVPAGSSAPLIVSSWRCQVRNALLLDLQPSDASWARGPFIARRSMATRKPCTSASNARVASSLCVGRPACAAAGQWSSHQVPPRSPDDCSGVKKSHSASLSNTFDLYGPGGRDRQRRYRADMSCPATSDTATSRTPQNDRGTSRTASRRTSPAFS